MEIVSTRGVQLEVLAEFKAKRSSWVILNGNEPVPQQAEIDRALDLAAQSSRYAVEHTVVCSLAANNWH